jgi:uncharacterized protein (DUF2141 family)
MSMMKGILFSLMTVGVIFGGMNAAAETAQNATLEILFDGIDERQGVLKLALCADEDEFYSQGPGSGVFRRESIDLVQADGEVRMVFADIPAGEYAARCFIDVNDNDLVDTGAFGIPTEPYGLSGNARAYSYKRSVFELGPGTKTITIKMRSIGLD